MTYREAKELGKAAANAQMRAQGRFTWTEEDSRLCWATVDALCPRKNEDHDGADLSLLPACPYCGAYELVRHVQSPPDEWDCVHCEAARVYLPGSWDRADARIHRVMQP